MLSHQMRLVSASLGNISLACNQWFNLERWCCFFKNDKMMLWEIMGQRTEGISLYHPIVHYISKVSYINLENIYSEFHISLWVVFYCLYMPSSSDSQCLCLTPFKYLWFWQEICLALISLTDSFCQFFSMCCISIPSASASF